MTDTSSWTRAAIESATADCYATTHDLAEFDHGRTVDSVRGRRDVVLSVRFAPEEIDALRARAAERDLKVTALVRAAALAETSPVDADQLRKAVSQLISDSATLGQVIGLTLT